MAVSFRCLACFSQTLASLRSPSPSFPLAPSFQKLLRKTQQKASGPAAATSLQAHALRAGPKARGARA